MSVKECPSCGSVIEDEQLYCPACGTKIEYAKPAAQKQVNRELESQLYVVNSQAEIALAKNLSAGLAGKQVYANLTKLETSYMEIIQRFPIESKPYIAYVDYMIKFVLKILSLKSIFTSSQYFIGDLNGIVARCKNYLAKAKEYADDGELEQILQLDSALTSQIEVIASDDSIVKKQEKNKKIQKWCFIGTAIFLGVLCILALICDALNI